MVARASVGSDRRLVIFLSGAMLLAEISLWAALFLHARGFAYVPDFVSFYAAGQFAQAGHPALAYDRSMHQAAENAIAGVGVGNRFFYYPPTFLLVCAALASLPYPIALASFEALALVLCLFVARAILGERGWPIVLPMLAFPPIFWNLALGQNGLLTAALMGAATLLIDRRPAVAGVLFGAICYKPHLGLLIPVALAAGGRGRAFAAALATVIAVCLLSLAVFGWTTWRAFLDAIPSMRAVYPSGVIAFNGFATPFGAVRMLGGSAVLAYGIQIIATVSAVILVAWTWSRELPLPFRAATLISATLIAVPTAFFYDFALDGVAAAWLLRASGRDKMKRSEMLLIMALLCSSIYAQFWGHRFPIVPLIAIAFFAVVAAAALRAPAVAARQDERSRTTDCQS